MGFTFSIKQGWNFLSSFGYPNSLNNIINNQAISNDIVVLFFLNLSHPNGPKYDSLTIDDNLEQGKGYWLYSQNNHINIAINTCQHNVNTLYIATLTVEDVSILCLHSVNNNMVIALI